MSKLVAVTGGTGFVGLNLIPALAKAGWRIRLLVRRLPVHPALANIRFEAVMGDLTDPLSMERLISGADAVVHLGGAIKAATRASFFQVNAKGVEIAAQAAAHAHVKHFILVSSIAAREPTLSAYAASKREGEERLRLALDDKCWTILRLGAIYGPWDRETLAVFQWGRRGIVPLLGPSSAKLGLIHVTDTVSAILAALAGAGRGGVFALDDGYAGGYRWTEVAEAVAKATGRRVWPVPISPTILHYIARMNMCAAGILGYGPTVLTVDKVREIQHSDWTAGSETFATAGAWRPGIQIDSGFEDTMKWYQRMHWL